MKNATSSTSPHMLTRGQQPKCPMDTWCDILHEGEANSYEEFALSNLKAKQETLQKIAQENINRNLERVRISRNKGRTFLASKSVTA